jgi:hypothetical protein
MCTSESVIRWPDNLSRSTSSECIYCELHPLSGHGSMLGAFLFCRTDYESALGRSAPEPDPSGGMAMIAPILKRTRVPFVIETPLRLVLPLLEA